MNNEQLPTGSVRIRTTYETYTPEDIEVGDTNNRGYEDEEGRIFDPSEYQDEENPARALAEDAARYVLDGGGVHPSSSPVRADESTWWTSEGDQDYYTGGQTFRSFHLDGDIEAVAAVQRILAARTRNHIR